MAIAPHKPHTQTLPSTHTGPSIELSTETTAAASVNRHTGLTQQHPDGTTL
jgi:hypothetical protein